MTVVEFTFIISALLLKGVCTCSKEKKLIKSIHIYVCVCINTHTDTCIYTWGNARVFKKEVIFHPTWMRVVSAALYWLSGITPSLLFFSAFLMMTQKTNWLWTELRNNAIMEQIIIINSLIYVSNRSFTIFKKTHTQNTLWMRRMRRRPAECVFCNFKLSKDGRHHGEQSPVQVGVKWFAGRGSGGGVAWQLPDVLSS